MAGIEELQSGSLKLDRWHSEIKEIGKQNSYVENSNSNHSYKVEKITSILEITAIWNHKHENRLYGILSYYLLYKEIYLLFMLKRLKKIRGEKYFTSFVSTYKIRRLLYILNQMS
jgi:hypothetical protein